MSLKIYKPITPSLRAKKSLNFSILTTTNPKKNLTKMLVSKYGRNNQGKITSKSKERGHKKLYRIIDFKRNLFNVTGTVKTIEYDPYRNVNISLIEYTNNIFKYILHPKNLLLNTEIISSVNSVPLLPGNTTCLKNLPLGTLIHNIEINQKQGGKLIRAAGTFAKILAKSKNYVLIRLSSKELRLIHENCLATIGVLDNEDFYNINRGKAGLMRHLGIRPNVRGSAMNACDHPHGGGEGKTPIGYKHPRTPWGKIALGKKTRKLNKASSKFILN